MNQRRLLMPVLLVIAILYHMGTVDINDSMKFSFALAALLLSISSAINTYGSDSSVTRIIRGVLDTLAIAVVIIMPNLSNVTAIKEIMQVLDSNALLLIALFLILVVQISIEIRIKKTKDENE